MNYYPFHMGDYAAHTAHLEPMEDLAYRRMLDLYYLREQALPADPAEVARLIRMRGNVAEVEAVLREFFTSDDGQGWIHLRCEAEIAKMQDKQAKAKASAQASVNARQARQTSERTTNAERTLNERSTDVELPTPTPTPTPVNTGSGPALRTAPPPPPFDGENAEVLNGKSVVALATHWALPEQWGLDAEALGWKPVEVEREAEKFRQYWTAGRGIGTRRSVKGWRQSWSTWLEKAARDRR